MVEAKKNKNNQNHLEYILRNGFTYNGLHYTRFGKSSSQGKSGITVFVESKIYDELFIISQLEIPVDKCVVSKYENQRCLTFSTCTLIDGRLPYIVIVDEYKKIVKDQLIRYVVEKRKTYVNKDTGKEGEYTAREVEEGIRDIELSPFDGFGCHNRELSEKVSNTLQLDYTCIGLQVRLPFIKGFSIEFPFKEYFKSIGINQITDVFGNTHKVEDIDCIWNISMFKGYKLFNNKYGSEGWNKYLEIIDKYEYKLGISKYSHHLKHLNLKTRMNFQYLQCLDLWNEKYIDWFGRDKSKEKDKDRDEPKYFDFLDKNNHGKIIKLAEYTTDLYENIIKGNKFYTYKFLGIDDTEDIETNDNYAKSILINDIMLKDPTIKSYIYRKLKKRIDQMKVGKIYADGLYHTVVGDVIGYLEYAAGKESIGCLNGGEFYCDTLKYLGDILSFRSPLVCPSEVNNVKVVHNDFTDKWFKHFKDQDVVMINMYDLSMPRQGGMDEDGDGVYLCTDQMLIDSKIHKTMIIDIDDKITSKESDYNIDSIVQYEMNSRDNRIGEITNIATSILNKYTTDKDRIRQNEDLISLLRIYQGKEIDYLKTGVRWQLSKHLRNYLQQLPYFLLFNYPDKLNKYYKIKRKNKQITNNEDKIKLNAYHSPSPLNELAEYVCEWEKKKILWDRSTVNTGCLLVDNKLFLNDKNIIKQIRHIINEFAVEWKSLCSISNYDDDAEISIKINALIKHYESKLRLLMSDKWKLANYVIKTSYLNSSICKTLAWNIYGDIIIKNLKNNSPKSKSTKIIEVPSYTDGAYEFLGKYYLMIEEDNIID